MSKYTTEVRYICETEYGLKESAGSSRIEEILADVAPKIFDFDFPIFDENYRLALEIKILRHFYTREIGSETVGLWKLRLNDKMNEVMPYLNKFYAMYVSEVNPLYEMDYTKQHYGANDSTNDYSNSATSTSENTSNDQRLYSDTPQGELSDVQNGKYLTNATFDSGKNTGTAGSVGMGNNVIKTTDAYFDTVQGRSGKFVGDAWKSFYDGFMNVDKMLFKELEVLFMQLW